MRSILPQGVFIQHYTLHIVVPPQCQSESLDKGGGRRQAIMLLYTVVKLSNTYLLCHGSYCVSIIKLKLQWILLFW